ncbi:BTB and MATH domain-containing protein 41 [Borealophlyctis nickersoniae]|nr:BTB and MATH domain-containing protein 41 [Borealophlyctis nickersoniae]
MPTTGKIGLSKLVFDWTITDYERARVQDVSASGVLLSPTFGPPEQRWALSLYPRETHLALFLKAIKTAAEKETDEWTRQLDEIVVSIRGKNGKWKELLKISRPFNEQSRNWGNDKILEGSEVTSHYLQNDGSLVLGVRIEKRLPQTRLTFFPPNHRNMLFSEEFSDVKILTADGSLIPAHKILLNASPFFRTHFNFNEKQGTSSDEAIKSHFSTSCTRSLLEFLYVGRLTVHAPKSLADRCNLIRVADMYQLPDLHKLVATAIIYTDLNEKNAPHLLIFADKYGEYPGCGTLRDACIGYIKSNLKTLSLQKGFGDWISKLSEKLVKLLYANLGAEAELQGNIEELDNLEESGGLRGLDGLGGLGGLEKSEGGLERSADVVDLERAQGSD